MAVADLASEWFESEPLRATIAAGGVLGSFLGPWSAGSAAVLLMLGAGEGHPVASGWFVAGGPGALADALAAAARQAGVEIRTGAEVARIEAADGIATGVTLAIGRHDRGARRRVERRSEADAARPARSDAPRRPRSSAASRTSARTARSRRSTTRCRRCRAFPASRRSTARSARCIVRTHPPGARHRRHRARVRRGQIRRLRRRAVDRADDPVDRRPGARAARPARGLGVRAVRAVSPARHDLGRRARSPRGRRDADDRSRTRPASSPRSSRAR